jgi:superfamily II DNA/RNA helicase
MASERAPCAVSIVGSLPGQSRIILFCERIQAAEKLYRELSERYPNQAGMYHSKMADVTRQEILERYKDGECRLLISCKALDEGLNIPSTDAGIIVSTSMSARQRVQRLGRMLRHSKEIKRIFYLYVDESMEDSELVYGLGTFGYHVPVITLNYNKGLFVHSEYEKLRESVLAYVAQRKNDQELLGALSRNIDRALLRGDFLLSEQMCRESMQSSRSVARRNYWVSVLYIIRARQKKL